MNRFDYFHTGSDHDLFVFRFTKLHGECYLEEQLIFGDGSLRPVGYTYRLTRTPMCVCGITAGGGICDEEVANRIGDYLSRLVDSRNTFADVKVGHTTASLDALFDLWAEGEESREAKRANAGE